MTDRDSRDRNRDTVFDALTETMFVADPTPLSDAAIELRDGLDQFGLGPTAIERALDGATVPELGDIDVETAVQPAAEIGDDRADAIVDTGEQTVEMMIEGSGEAASVLVDTGSEVVEVTTDGGEVAAEATAELLVTALDGL